MNNIVTCLNSVQLKRALAIRQKIESLESTLAALCGSSAPAAAKAPRKRRMSAAGRAAISRAAKARWAKVHAAQKAK